MKKGMLYWMPKMHKTQVDTRFIIDNKDIQAHIHANREFLCSHIYTQDIINVGCWRIQKFA